MCMTFRNSIKDIMLKKFFNWMVALFATSSAVSAQTEPIKVLFIGNSYTHMNDMPSMFDKISNQAGMNVLVEKCAQSGASFKVHSERPEVYESINKRKWDYIILQGYSRELTFEPSEIDTATVPYLNKIMDSIRKNNECTNVLFYMTWGYEDGYHERENVNSYLKMTHKIEEGYRYLSDVYNAPVVPVGMVWKEVKALEAMDLYVKDRAHPSKYGSFLIASTFFQSIFGVQQGEDIGIVKERRAKKISKTVHDVLGKRRELYKLDRIGIELEEKTDESDPDKTLIAYNISYPGAKLIEVTFGDGQTVTGYSGVHAVKNNIDNTQVRVDVITECDDRRTYYRYLEMILNERNSRRKKRK